MRGRNDLERIASLCVHLLRRFWLTLHRSGEMLLRRHQNKSFSGSLLAIF